MHYGGVWGLLSGLAYFLTPGQEEEEVMSHLLIDSLINNLEMLGTGFVCAALEMTSPLTKNNYEASF